MSQDQNLTGAAQAQLAKDTTPINPADYAVRLTTTLNLLKKAGACRERYAHLVKALGGTSVDHNAPINLLTILELNGTEDCLWALCATEQNCDQVARLMAADFAEAVLPIFERELPNDMRPRQAIQAARDFAVGRIGAAARDAAWDAAWAAARDAARAAARDAAWAAARDAAWDAAWAAARDAARAAARDAAWAAARDAAWDAARAAAGDAAWDAAWDAARAAAGDAARAAQSEIIKRYLLPEASC
jgi:hypothetical protein